MPKKQISLNSSAWMKLARSKNLDVSFLLQDKSKVLEFFQKQGMPYHPYIFFKNPSSTRVKKMFNGLPCFCRLIPKDSSNLRPARLNILTQQKLEEFCSPYDLSQYKPMLVQHGNITHSGGIIVDSISDGTVTELVNGTGPDLFHGKKTPFNARNGFINTRTLKHLTNTPSLERKLMYLAMKHIGGPNNPFPGYYEFDVLDNIWIKFRNYQPPDTAYAKL